MQPEEVRVIWSNTTDKELTIKSSDIGIETYDSDEYSLRIGIYQIYL